MQKIIIIIFCFFNYLVFFAQKEIIYHVAPSVKDSLQKNLNLDNKIGCLWQTEGEFVNLIFFEIDVPMLDSMANNTSRYLYFDEYKSFPIIFYSDFYFSSISNEFNDGIILTSEIVLGGYFIKIDGRFMSGKILKAYFED